MHISFYIAKRYLFSKSKNNAINIINLIASLGIVVGAASLFVVLSVFSGLKEFSLSFSNAIDPDFKIINTHGKSFFVSPQQIKQIKKIEGVIAFSKIIEERVLFTFSGKQEVTLLKGVDSTFKKVNNIEKKILNGQWLSSKTFQVVVGYGIAQKFSLGVYDFNNPMEVFVPKPGEGLIENPTEAFSSSVILPVGIYAISEDLDSKYVFADLSFVQELLNYKNNQISGIEIKIKSKADEEKIRKELNKIFNNKITIKNREQLNESLYKMLNTENIAVYLIFTLVIIIALFNLIGTLIMMILDKKSNFKTLFNLGVSIKKLRQIILLQGSLLSVFAGIFGLFLGVVLVLFQSYFQLIMITPSLAYPVVFTFENVLLVLLTISVLGFIASFLASSRINKKLLD